MCIVMYSWFKWACMMCKYAYMGPAELLSPGLCTPVSPSLWQILSTSHIPVCLSGAVTVHSSSPANTFVLSWSWQCARSLSLKKKPSVQLECSLYKRHPSASLEWFFFAVHLSSVCHSFFFWFSLSLCSQFWPSKQNMKNIGIETTWLFSIEMQSSFW